jgi:zona occludens toxin
MALNGYFGKPGSGKSYSVVEYVIIPALKKGRHVVTNIPLDADLLVQVYGGRITQLPLDCLDDPGLPGTIPAGCVAIIDECWRRWPSGQKVSNCSKEDLQWLKEHRHRVDSEGNAQQVVLVTQDPADLAAWVRKLIAHSFHMHKWDSIGAANRFGIKVYQGCPTGDRIPPKLMIREAIGTYKPEIYQYYQSATQSETTEVGDEKSMDKRSSVFGPGMIALVLGVVIAGFGGFSLLQYYLGMADRAAERQEAVTGRPVPSAARLQAPELPSVDRVIQQADFGTPAAKAAQPASQAPASPSLSQQWRVKGYLQRGEPGGSKVAWQSMTGYGAQNVVESQDNWLHDLVVLEGLGVKRHVPASDCTRYPNSRDYYCDVDGERVTPWSGQMGYSAEVVGNGSVTGVKEAAPKAVDKTL